MKNNVHKNIFSQRKFYILGFFATASVIIILFLSSSPKSVILFFLLLNFLFSFLLFRKIQNERQAELERIKKVIEGIRKNSFREADEIVLGREFEALESEIKYAFLKAQTDIRSLKKLEQARSEFLGNVSHELRTPIFAIQGFIETLLDGAIDDKNVNRIFLEKANNHLINLNNLLSDLIDISMIEAGQMLMSFRYFNGYEFLNSTVQELIPAASNKNILLQVEPFDEEIKFFGDRKRLTNVMNNLILNAVKYTEQGSVTVGVRDEADRYRIYVKDTGIGIPESDLKRVFERFYRVDRDRSREMGGTGLGLAIVKHIVEAHGYTVQVESELGRGSEFSFCLKK